MKMVIKMAKKKKEEMTEEEKAVIEKNTKRAARDMALEYGPFVIILIFIVLIRTFICSPVRVDGSSMNPTLTDGDYMLLYKLKMKKQGINRFDIVVVNTDKTTLVKRVIGLPGEFVKYEVKEQDGEIKPILYINDKVVEENFLSEDFKIHTCKYKTDLCENGVQLGENEYFVMGDNRSNSHDSRYIGGIDKGNIKGIVELRLFPFNHIGSVKGN